jgi:hypothetical protein
MDPDPAIFVIELQDAKKLFLKSFSAYYLLKVHLHHFSKIKCHKEVTNSRNQGFSYYFCLMIEGSGSGSVPLTNGSGSRRPQLKILHLDQLIQFNILKFMHSFTYNKLPMSFHRMWTTYGERFPDRILRNADNLFIPSHNYATLKRMPMINFPSIWNSDSVKKLNPIQHQYLKDVKRRLSSNLV